MCLLNCPWRRVSSDDLPPAHELVPSVVMQCEDPRQWPCRSRGLEQNGFRLRSGRQLPRQKFNIEAVISSSACDCDRGLSAKVDWRHALEHSLTGGRTPLVDGLPL